MLTIPFISNEPINIGKERDSLTVFVNVAVEQAHLVMLDAVLEQVIRTSLIAQLSPKVLPLFLVYVVFVHTESRNKDGLALIVGIDVRVRYEKSFAGVWEYATAADIGKAAKDWPQMNFVVYHSALRPAFELPDQAWAEFEASGRIKWTSDLADIPAKYGVNNVYGEIGTSFANSAVAHPKFSAALIGTLVKGLGADHVMWGTDSVWYGSPQWQIEAMRRLEIPEDMQKKYGFAPLGGANSATKQAIFGLNSARLYRINLKAADATPMPAYSADKLAQLKKEYEFAAKEPSNLRYGYVRAG